MKKISSVKKSKFYTESFSTTVEISSSETNQQRKVTAEVKPMPRKSTAVRSSSSLVGSTSSESHLGALQTQVIDELSSLAISQTEEDLVVGIDLGTTNSCVALYKNNTVKILENEEGDKVTPSCIFFPKPDVSIIGKHAKTMSELNPELGFYELKRLIGKKYNKFYMKNFLFSIESSISNDPVIVVPYKDNVLKKTPQELYTILLKKLKENAERKLGKRFSKAVITVPAYFNVFQREITLAAAKDAGLTVLKLLNEPTAAALSYLFEFGCKQTSYSLVYDLGGGTFDVAILKRDAENIEIVGVSGDTQLGGHDLDRLIFDYVSEQLAKEHSYDLKSDKVNMRRVSHLCEEAKKELSEREETEIYLLGVVASQQCLTITLTRKQFEKMADSLFKKTIDIVDMCIRNSGVSKSSFKEVILCGGSTRIPKIQKMLKKYFNGKTLNKLVNPEECVAEGAALQAAMLSKHPDQTITKIRLKDVVPLSLGISVLGDEMDVLIKRNTPVPATVSVDYDNVRDQQTSMSFAVYEGERSDVKKNRFLGELLVDGITPAPPRHCKVTLTMEVDDSGILKLKAKEWFHDDVRELIVGCTRGDQSESEIKYALWDAERNQVEDQRFTQFAKSKRYLINYCTAVLVNLENKNLVNQYGDIYHQCKDSLINGTNTNLDEEIVLMRCIKDVRERCGPLIEKYNFTLIPELE